MTRISFLQTFNQGLRGINTVNSKLYETQNQIATGKRVNQPSDDPIAAAKILQLDDELARLSQYKKNIDGAENSLMNEESQLEAITNLLTRVRELVTSAGNPALSAIERKSITTEVTSRLDELLSLANSRNTSGEYIFGGYQGEQEPFIQNAGSYQYRGDEGQRNLQISSSTYIAMGHNGKELFQSIPLATVPASAGTLVASTTAAATNTGAGSVSNGAVIDAALFSTTFTADSRYQIEITDDIAAPAYNYNILDRQGNVVDSGTTDPVTPISFGGAEFTVSGAPVLGDRFSLAAPRSTISSGNIVDRGAYETSFSSPASTYQISITGFTAPDQYTYEVLDSSNTQVASGSFVNGEKITFGGTEFRILDAAAGDTFQLTPSTSQNMLDTVAKFANGLAGLGDGPEDVMRLQDLIAETLSNLEMAEDNVGVIRAEVGARLNTLDSTRDMHEGTELVSNKVMSEVRDLDYADALTRLTQQNIILEAAQQSFAKISKLSLFNFL
jgi:flagellar hook-associated protein 3 FlgL